MKKKHRDITVDGKQYGWRVKRNSRVENEVTIWKDKKVIFNQVMRSDDIRPANIAEKIKELEHKN